MTSFTREVVLHLVVPVRAGEHLVRHLASPAHPQGEDVLAVAQAQRAAVLLGVHACVPDEDTAPQPPAAQVILHTFHRGNVARLPGEGPRAYRQPVTGSMRLSQ